MFVLRATYFETHKPKTRPRNFLYLNNDIEFNLYLNKKGYPDIFKKRKRNKWNLVSSPVIFNMCCSCSPLA